MNVIYEREREKGEEEKLILEIPLTHQRRLDIFVEGQFY